MCLRGLVVMDGVMSYGMACVFWGGFEKCVLFLFVLLWCVAFACSCVFNVFVRVRCDLVCDAARIECVCVCCLCVCVPLALFWLCVVVVRYWVMLYGVWFGCVCCRVCLCVIRCVLFLMYRVMSVWYVLCVFMFVRVVVKCVCVLLANCCAMLNGVFLYVMLCLCVLVRFVFCL